MTPSVAAVIVTWNSGDLVGRVCQALLDGERSPTRTIVVDNASSDPASLASLEQLPAGVELLRLPENTGFCGGNNAGIDAAGAVDYLLLCNPDVFVTPSFLAGAVQHLEQRPQVGAVGPKLLGVDAATGQPNGTIDSTGIMQTWYGRFVDRGQGAVDDGTYDGPPEPVAALCAAAALYRRTALDSVTFETGPFDERFFIYKEDIDLSLRLRRAGWGVELRSDLVVHHQRGLAGARHASAPAHLQRRSLANEWRIWRRGTLPITRRVTMLPYLVAKSVAVAVRR